MIPPGEIIGEKGKVRKFYRVIEARRTATEPPGQVLEPQTDTFSNAPNWQKRGYRISLVKEFPEIVA